MLVMKSAFAALLLLQVFGHWHQVYSYENDDLVFDTDGKFAVEVPLIEKHEEGLIHRIKRGIADWFSPWKSIITTTTSPPTVTTTEVPKVESLQSSTIATNVRLIRNSGEVTDEHNNVEGNDDKDEDNDVGVVAAGHRQGFTEDDDEDWAGSGDADGSGTSEPEIPTVQPVGREAKFYRVTLTVLEPYIAEYADTQSPEFVELSSSLKQALVELLSRRIPNFDHFANVVKISPSEDPFDSEVTLNIGTTFTDESKIREVLENQLSYHSLGNVKVSPEGFTFRNFQEECNENSELRCRDGTCVPLTSRCDGTVQCPDQSDELDCPTVTVRPTEESSTEEESITEEPAPISRGGTNLYESVTRIAPTNNCRGDDSVRCTDGSRSICSVQKCDGIPDCDDAGDERDCGQSCGSGEFSCDVSRCILDRQRCDFIDDCEDQSDERDCNYPACTQNEFRCRNNQCIDSRQRCNGADDCHDKSDELNCPCKQDQFECTPGYCIPKEKRCDQWNDCSNGRDEQDCPNNTGCRRDQFDCGGGHCIDASSRCNGHPDCPNYADERNCTETTCSSEQFRCSDGACVGIEKRCNGHPDCRNGEDELQCGCGATEFRCNDGQCIPYNLQCNNYNDCRDGSDERDCGNVNWRNLYNAKKFDDFVRRLMIAKLRRNKRRKHSWMIKKDKRIRNFPHSGKNIENPIMETFPEINRHFQRKVKSSANSSSPKEEWDSVNIGKDNIVLRPLEEAKKSRETMKKFAYENLMSWKDVIEREKLLNEGERVILDKLERGDYGEQYSKKIVDVEENKIPIDRSKNDMLSKKKKKFQKTLEYIKKYNLKKSTVLPLSLGAMRFQETMRNQKIGAAKKSNEVVTKNPKSFDEWKNENLKSSRKEWQDFVMERSKSILMKRKKVHTANLDQKSKESIESIKTFTESSELLKEISSNSSAVGLIKPTSKSKFLEKLGNSEINNQVENDNAITIEEKLIMTGTVGKRTVADSIIPRIELSKSGLANVQEKYQNSSEAIKNLYSRRNQNRYTSRNRISKYPSPSVKLTFPQGASKKFEVMNSFKNKKIGRYLKKWNITDHLQAANDSSERGNIPDHYWKYEQEQRWGEENRQNSADKKNWKEKSVSDTEIPENIRFKSLTDSVKVESLRYDSKNNTPMSIPLDIEIPNEINMIPSSLNESEKSLSEINKKINSSNTSIISKKKTKVKISSERMKNSVPKKHRKVKKNRYRKKEQVVRKKGDNKNGNVGKGKKVKTFTSSTLEVYSPSSSSSFSTFFNSNTPDVINSSESGLNIPNNVTESTVIEISEIISPTKPTTSCSWGWCWFFQSQYEEVKAMEVVDESLMSKISNSTENVSNITESTSKNSTNLCWWWLSFFCSESVNNEETRNKSRINLETANLTFRRNSTEEFVFSVPTSGNSSFSKTKKTIYSSPGVIERNNFSLNDIPPLVAPPSTFITGDAEKPLITKKTLPKLDKVVEDSELEMDEELTLQEPISIVVKRALFTEDFDDIFQSIIPTLEDLNSEQKCREDQHICGDEKCIDEDHICDDIYDCEDQSDEENCDYFFELSNEFEKEHKMFENLLINESSLINSEKKSYEAVCDRETQFACDNGECIRRGWFCDGFVDCSDASDEICTENDFTVPGHNRVTERPGECDRNTEMRCGDGKCISLRLRCDNIPDCADNSDERDCGRCALNEWRCAGGECLPESVRCDGRPDCRDGSDEEACVTECPAGKFQCDDGLCIDESLRCDGRPNCRDGSDENYCQSPYCPSGQLACANGVCISERFFCDQNVDCLDGSDELHCPEITTYPPSTQCKSDEFTCQDRSCIPKSSVCDRRQDCPGNEDELDCKRGCSRGQFRCNNGDCISGDKKCNRFIDCDDGSDEDGCDAETTIPSVGRHCPRGQFPCLSDRICVLDSARCNGIPECVDGSDENGCSKRPQAGLNLKTYPSFQIIKESGEVVFQCRDEGDLRARVRWLRGNNLPLPPGSVDKGDGRLEIPNIQLDHSGPYICEAVGYPPSTPGQRVEVDLKVEHHEVPSTRPPQVCKYDEATCSNGDCIPKSFVCNGKFDCTDGSDEMRCNPFGCEPNQFRCTNKQCVSKIWRCDGDKDCTDGSDEENCGTPPPGSICRYDQFQCQKYDQCIPKSFHCDMERDCQDGSDEFGCSPVYITRPPPPMVVLNVGETMILTCSAIGIPIPEINWRLNWGHVPSKCISTSSNGTGSLTCPDISISDQGAYSCEALNIAGFVFAIPDAILIVKDTPTVCPRGQFNSEARRPEECISCFCFGVTDQCNSAKLFTHQLLPPFDRHKVVEIDLSSGRPEIRDELSSKVAEIRPIGRFGVEVSMTHPYNDNFAPSSGYSIDIPYFALPEAYHGSQLNSYGGYLKYTIRYSGDGRNNSAPAVILSGNGYTLSHKGHNIQPNQEIQESIRFFYGEWYKNERGRDIPATRQDIMMALANVDNILIKAKYDDSLQLDISITDIVMESANEANVGLGIASFVEECSCPSGYTGLSCEHCASGHERRKDGPWLGECYRSESSRACQPGYYGDPSRNIPCEPCPCPLTNPSNQFGRTCKMKPNREPICDCPPGYMGDRCETCAPGYRGNPMIPGDMCVPEPQCDPHGSLTPFPDQDGKCRCKNYATGLTCDQCKPNTFNRASKNQFGCISCFCMGITNRCTSSNWFRNEVHVSFTSSIRDFSLVQSQNREAPAIASGIHIDSTSREIIYKDFPNRGGNDVYYWQLPSIFLGNQITSYGGNLKYTVRYVPAPGGQSSRNSAADVELISSNDINLLYYSRKSPEPNSSQSFEVPLLEQFWQRTDGTQADREHLLMALADIQAIRIKATYTTNTDETAISQVSLDTAEKYNTGKERAVEVEECSCPSGYTGLSCEDCAVGYTRAFEGLYLGICEPCNCNGHSSQCDSETGICENCADHTTGDNCEFCEAGYIGDATRGTPRDCIAQTNTSKPCNLAGTRGDPYINGRCECKLNVEGPECSRCRPGTFGLSAENTNGCNQCYCSGVSDQCHESSLYIQQIPMWIYDTRHGFTLTDASRIDVIDDVFDINIAMNEIGYRFTAATRNRRLFWSLPAIFTGNKIKSYGGNLTLTQRFSATPRSQPLKDQDVTLVGNGITLFWTNDQEIVADKPLTYSILLRESEWRRLSTEGPRSASRTDLMTVLANIETILVRASFSEGMIDSFISDISLDTAVENLTGKSRATQIEACRCPLGYTGTSCENCARGYYRDVNDRSVSKLGSCNACPCSDHEESCETSRSGQIKCHCLSGFTGTYCQDIVDHPPPIPTPPPTITPPRIVVLIQENKFQIVHTGSTVRYHCSGRSLDNNRIRIHWEKEGGRLPDRSMDDAQGLLVIRDVKVSDSGVYICHVTDDHEVVIDKVTLTVGGSTPVEPKAVIRPIYQQLREGEPVEFTCEGEGNPVPHLEWIRVDGKMNPEATFSNGTWKIPAVTLNDAAEYKCIARNNIGVNEQTTILYVDENPDKPGSGSQVESGPIISPKDWTGSTGDTVRLICSRSNYHANVEWIRSGNLPLPRAATQRDGVLTITNPVQSDSGIYICIATSNQGTESSTTSKVTINARQNPPRITVEPEKQRVSQGTIAEVKCLVNERDPNLEVKWIKYGVSSLGPRAQQQGTTLKIISPQVSDRGVYICRASNPSGVFEASAIIEVEPRETPTVDLYPKNMQTVILGGSTDLQCRVLSGSPTPELHWSRQDGRPFDSNVEQLPGGLLRLTNITMNDGGAYQCSATNQVGSASAIARIEVQSIPVITITPTNGVLRVKLQDRVKLTCSAEGQPMPNVAWSKYTSGYPSYTPFRSQPSAPLTAIHEINSMSADDEGSYTCTATNAAGIAEERVHVEIEDDDGNSVDDPEACRGDQPCNIPPTRQPDYPVHRPQPNNDGLDIPDDNLRIPIGGKVEMRCRVVGRGRIYLDWIRSDRRNLPIGSSVHEGVLTINKATRDAAGEYVCLGLDHSGSEVFRRKAYLEIISPPRIILNPNTQTVAPGENPSITCTATGDDPMKIEWNAIGRELPSSVSDDRGVLRFRGITYTDAGKYLCKASNDVGTAEAVAEVLVNENSYDSGVRAPERDVETSPGNSVRLRCDTRDSASIQWTREGKPLPKNSRVGDNYLELLTVRPEDSGRYICQIRNTQGVGSSDYIDFSVRSPAGGPVVKIEPSSNIVNIGDTFDLKCSFPSRSRGLPRFRWYKDGSIPVAAQVYDDNLRIAFVQMSDSGIYNCRVDTEEGTFEQNFNLIVQGGENDEPAIEMKSVAYGSDADLECRVEMPGSVSYKWNKLSGILPEPIMKENNMKLVNVRGDAAGTYICTASNGAETTEVPTILVVTGVVPNFSQAPRSFIALPPLPDSYLKFNIEVSFKPESYNGIILYNAERKDGSGDFVILSLVNGYPEFKFDLGSGCATIKSNKSVTIGEWHTVALLRVRKDGIMLVDGEGPFKATTIGRKQGLDLKERLYIGGVPDDIVISHEAVRNDTNRTGFVGCISRLEVGEKIIDLMAFQSDSVGVTTCETCAENPCHNSAVCQEATTKEGYTCLCRPGYSGKYCDNIGQSCHPGACGKGTCVDTETGFECHCPYGTQGSRCERTDEISTPAFRNERSFLAYQTPKAMRRAHMRDNGKSKRSHARSYVAKLKETAAKSSHLNLAKNHDNKV